MKYQNKGDNDWQITSNNYACWHSNIFFLYVLLFLSCTISGSTGPGVTVRMSLWPGRLDRAVHACLSACVGVLFVVLLHLSLSLNFCVRSSCTCQLNTPPPNTQTEPLNEEGFPPPKYHCRQQ